MKRILYISVALLLWSCDKQTEGKTSEKTENITTKKTPSISPTAVVHLIKGTINTPDTILPSKVELYKARGRESVLLNTSKINEDGSFEIGLNDDELWLYSLRVDDMKIDFINDVKEIEINISHKGVEFPNSKESRFVQQITNLLQSGKTAEVKEFVLDNAPSYTSFIYVSSLSRDDNYDFIKSVANKFSEKEHLYASKWLKTINSFVGIGSQAPEIKLQNPEGNTVALSSLKGKYVLIDFWASWCGPCIQEMPNVRNAYAKYKSKGFEVFGVSLDSDKGRWKAAIHRLKLPWTHVSDLKKWSSPVVSQYQISGIPHTVLIDPTGKIIAKNLRGTALEAKLTEVLK